MTEFEDKSMTYDEEKEIEEFCNVLNSINISLAKTGQHSKFEDLLSRLRLFVEGFNAGVTSVQGMEDKNAHEVV